MRTLTLLVTALLLLAFSSVSQAKTVPVSDFIRHPAFKSVTISPDGKYLSVVTAVKDSDRYQLAFLPTQSVVNLKPKITAHLGLANYEQFGAVIWVNKDRAIVSSIKQTGGFNHPHLTGKLYALNADGSDKIQLMGRAQHRYFLGLLNRLPENPRAILVYGTRGYTNKSVAYWLDVYTGKMHKVASSPVAGGGLLADHNGDVRIATGVNTKSGWPEIYYRGAGSMDWKNKTSIIGKTDAASALQTGGPIMFGPDNKSVYFKTWADNPAMTMALYSFNLATGKKRLLYANPEVDLGSLITSFDRKSLVGLRIYPGKPEVLALNAKSPRIQLLAALQQTFPKAKVNITSWTRDGNEAIVRTWGDTQPPNYYLYSSKPSPKLTFLFHETPWLKPAALSPMKPISFKSRDGLTIHGYLTLPRGKKPKNLPMVVYVHGGPHGIRVHWGFEPTSFDSVAEQILANHGYAVLSLNYRGSGGYGFNFLADGFRHWGDTMQNDLADGAKWAINQGYANPQQVCIFGGSYGGYAALMNPERFPDLYKCAVGYSGCYDLVLEQTRASDTARSAAGRLYMQTVLGENAKELKAFSPAYNADKLTIPVLLLHGGRDQRCPVDGYDHMVAGIKKNGTPLKTLFYNTEGHGFYKIAHREEAWKEMLAFFGKYIGPGADTVASTASN